MEWCDQGDLQDALDKGGLDHSRLWQWMLEISAGLAHLHGQGILHRDLKTENVLIDAHGRAKLADLGLAQVDVLLEKKEIAAVNGGLLTIDEVRTPGAVDIQRGNDDASGDLAVQVFGHTLANPIGTSAGIDKGAMSETEVPYDMLVLALGFAALFWRYRSKSTT